MLSHQFSLSTSLSPPISVTLETENCGLVKQNSFIFAQNRPQLTEVHIQRTYQGNSPPHESRLFR